ncbi:hypothetical protein OF83DRAFT_1241216 [Amylostereum chailletii]|nr:hypothetical protein OF83DRAFT_1241216 [Amylostereum chailletii]
MSQTSNRVEAKDGLSGRQIKTEGEEEEDLGTEHGLLAYLARCTPFAGTRATRLSGGSGNYVFRVELAAGSGGEGGEGEEGRKSVVVKHAKGHLPRAPTWMFGVERQAFEVGVMKRVREAGLEGMQTEVPEVLWFDEKACVLVMKDAGADCKTLKEHLREGLDPKVAREIGKALGRFLKQVHGWGRESVEAREYVGGNEVGKSVVSRVTYGRLVGTLEGRAGIDKLQDIGVEVGEDEMSVVREVAGVRTKEIAEGGGDTVLMGDFWPGNVLVRLAQDGKGADQIAVVDWELSRPGRGEMDVGQFCGDVRVLTRFCEEAREGGRAAVRGLVEMYFGEEKSTGEVVTQAGTHCAVWGPRLGYECSRDEMRGLVLDGARYQTPLYFPHDWPYPIHIVQFHVRPNDRIDRGTRLLTYSFLSSAPPKDQDTPPVALFGTWDSPIEGTFNSWGFKERDKISRERATSRPAIHVTEPCKHGIQMGGLCALCGKDMTRSDHAGFSDASRATIQMNHSSNGPTVSFEEAQRIERETAHHLLRARKLSLIVDLDQTIVHATVDPTVGEWIAEGEAWEARQRGKADAADRRRRREEREQQRAKDGDDGSGDDSDESTDSDDTVSDSEEEVNPNWEALKDIKSFRLGPESFGVPSTRAKGKERAMDHGCLYFIKPRPGWRAFLSGVAAKYEMHVYTMGTRAYAEEVCAAIDPDGKFFGGRILSRDESGSMTQKSLERLFPVDTSMVVIIDDRADVWGWSANLIKVIPYDFFVGIGDINSSFLPKVDPSSALMAAPSPSSGPSPTTTAPSSSTRTPTPPTSAPDSPASSETAVDAELSPTQMLEENSAALEAQVEERPLAKMQEQLQDDAAAAAAAAVPPTSASEPRKDEDGENAEKPDSLKPARKALLRNDDTELVRVKRFLDEVHGRFYDAYEKRAPGQDTHPRANRRRPSAPVPYSATYIIPRLRSETLTGVHILFSSVIPLDMKPESSEMWRMASAFGARCHTELSNEVTHLVANKRGTQKVDAARKRRGVKIVWLAWFTDSIARWERQDEGPYLLEGARGSGEGAGEGEETASASPSPVLETQQISSDPEPDADDWDVDRERGGKEGKEGTEGEGGVPVKLDEVSWEDANAELEAFLAEGDSDDEEDMDDARSSAESERLAPSGEKRSEDETSSVGRYRKRLRSITPSAAVPGDDALRSPLSKRKKLVADRRTASRLRESVSSPALARAQEEAYGDDPDADADVAMGGDIVMGGEEEEEEEEGTGTEADDFDFLAGALEEEEEEEEEEMG